MVKKRIKPAELDKTLVMEKQEIQKLFDRYYIAYMKANGRFFPGPLRYEKGCVRWPYRNHKHGTRMKNFKKFINRLESRPVHYRFESLIN